MTAKEMFEKIGYQQSDFSPEPAFMPIVTYFKIRSAEKNPFEDKIDVEEIIKCNIDFIEFKQVLGKSIGIYDYSGYLQKKDDEHFYLIRDDEHEWEGHTLLAPVIALEELKAINKQCEELGWLKEEK